MGGAAGSLSGLLEKTEREWTFICHSLDKALKDTQHTVFLIQVLFLGVFFPHNPRHMPGACC